MRKKILIQQSKIFHYRIPLFERLKKNFDIGLLLEPEYFKSHTSNIYISTVTVGAFKFQNPLKLIPQIKKCHKIILLANPRIITNFLLVILFPKKVIFWGPWKSKSVFANFIMIFSLKICRNSIITYSPKHSEFYIEKGISRKKFINSRNSLYVPFQNKIDLKKNRNSVLFVGSLNKRKGLESIIEQFLNFQSGIKDNVQLEIVGSGPLEDFLISKYGKIKNIQFHGHIESKDEKLVEIYNRAFVSVSLNQAGLSVIQSFGYGVPFITRENSISGGEKDNIIHNHNGFIIEHDYELNSILIELFMDKNKRYQLHVNSLNYYNMNCSIEQYIESFKKAING